MKFLNYPPFVGVDIEQVYEDLLRKYLTRDREKQGVEVLLGPLRYKCEKVTYPHWCHSVRVAVTTVAITKHLNMEIKPAVLAGLLHDCGKALIQLKVLGKTSEWTAEDGIAMQEHVLLGYRLIRDWFDFSAEIMLRHHTHQFRPYPAELPEPLRPFDTEGLASIEQYGRVLALADAYDAVHRINSTGYRTGEQVRQFMFATNPDQHALLYELYEADVMTVETESLPTL